MTRGSTEIHYEALDGSDAGRLTEEAARTTEVGRKAERMEYSSKDWVRKRGRKEGRRA